MSNLKNPLKALRSEQLGKNDWATARKKEGVQMCEPSVSGLCDLGHRLTRGSGEPAQHL